jgi:hypothetical protein
MPRERIKGEFNFYNLSLSHIFKIQSAFMIDLSQVSLALKNSTERSLVLIDEFGKGTLTEGTIDNHH